ncbi:MAG: pyruvate ferredoxin oxidoreductase [Firmicutes bacterium]|nr:pyruvate ferredoxin oxidoreductase [Bacillota bacterium]
MASDGARSAAVAGADAPAEGRVAARRLLTGAQAAAEAMRQIDPDVVPVYPITPQTPIIEAFARHLAEGRVHGEMVHVESEHSAMSAAVGSALAGARTMTATASQGLAYMVEVLYLAASLRAPIVVAVGNRALSGPINIHGDHSDAMLARDSGAVQLFAENAQEAYDLMLCAPRLCEHPEVRLPALVGQDGFTISHSAEPVALLEDAEAQAFVGPYREEDALLDVDRPLTHGAFAMPDAYFEIKVEQAKALERAEGVWAETAAAYRRLSGRDVAAVEAYRLEGAGRVLVAMGSAAGTAKDVVDELRARGEDVGLLKIRLFRPFPRARIAALLSGATAVGVLDRALSPGGWPPLYAEVAATLAGQVRVQSFVAGLGGRDVGPEEIHALFAALGGAGGQESVYLGLGRGGWR